MGQSLTVLWYGQKCQEIYSTKNKIQKKERKVSRRARKKVQQEQERSMDEIKSEHVCSLLHSQYTEMVNSNSSASRIKGAK